MTWHWKPVDACDLDQLVDSLNPQMKTLENNLGISRPAIMAGYPNHVGAITSHATVSHTGDTTETTLKTVSLGRGAISANGGLRVTAAGTCSGSSAAKDVRLKWGGITICTLNVATGTKDWSIVVDIWNIGSTQNQRWLVKAYDATTLETMDVGSDNVDTG